MKILLACPPTSDLESISESFYPVGLNCLKQYMAERGYDCVMGMHNREPWEVAERELDEMQPDVVGLTVYTHTRAAVQDYCQRVRKLAPGATIVLGGHHAAFMTDQVLRHFEVDAVVVDEGEIPFYEIVRAVEEGRKLDDGPGAALLRDGRVVRNPSPAPIEIDELPIESHHYPDRILKKEEALLMAGDRLGPEPWQYRAYWATTTRGCPYHCAFCSVLGRSSWRMESPQRVVDRMQYLQEVKNCGFITFGDSSMNVRPARLREICEEIIRSKVKIRWFASGMRANEKLLPEDLLEVMARADCAAICYGVESGSPEILRTIRKKLRPTDVDRAVTLTQKYGMIGRVSLMIGNPGETDETIGETLALLDRVKPRLAGIAVAQVYPGTELFDIAKAEGFMDDEYWLDGSNPIPFFPAADYSTTMKWYARVRFRATRGRTVLGWLHGLRASLRDRMGIDVGRGGLKFGCPAPPLFDRSRPRNPRVA